MNYNNVNWQPLFDWINKCIHLDVSFSITFDGKRPTIHCSNLADQSGIFSAVISKAEIDFFNFGKTDDGFWGTIALDYESWNGGSNGMLIGNVWYNTHKSSWKFETCKERTLKAQTK